MTHRSETMAAVVLALLAVNLLSVIRQKTITNDEFVHIPAGYYHLVDGAFQFNNEHPPLVKMWAALPLLLIQPDEHPLPDLRHANSDEQTWAYLGSFWSANEKRFERLAFWTRAMMVVLTLALGVLIYAYARALFNSRAALCAVVLYSIEPNVLAHGRVVHTDIAATLAYLCFFLALYAYERSSTWLRAGLVGVAFGGALVTKFSMIVLAPLFVCLVIARLFWAARRVGEARGRLLRHAAFVSLVVLFVVNCAYGFKSPPLATPDVQWVASQPAAVFAPLMRAFNFFSQLLPTHYLFGLYKVLLHNHNGHPASLLGSHSDFGWWYYFPVTFALKTTLPFLLLSAASIVWMLRRLLLGREKIFLYLLVPLAVYTFICVTSRINIGIRHFLPAFPFLLIAGGALLDRLLRMEGRGRVPAASLAALILLWAGAEALRAYPHYIPYMNQLVGQHPRWKYLSDSNVEWGDDVSALAAYLRARGEREVGAALSGGGTLRFFGVQYHELLAAPEVKRPDTRYVAIGASFLNGSTVPVGVAGRQSEDARINFFAAYRTRQPEAVFGHSIYLYRMRE